MKIKNKKILILPEYHLTDYPPQFEMKSNDAIDILMRYKKFGFDILITGYVEKFEGNLYSSCLILDNGNIFNIRKQYPYKDETNLISSWIEANYPLELSIGSSYFLLCNDIVKVLHEPRTAIGNHNIENLFLISAMFHNFDQIVETGIEYCKKWNIKRFITADRFNGIMKQIINI